MPFIEEWGIPLGHYNYQKALPLRQNAHDWKGVAGTLANIGHAYIHLGNIEEALVNLNRALMILKEIGEFHRQGSVLRQIAEAYTISNQHKKALDFLSSSLTVFQETGDQYGEAITRNKKKKIYRFQGKRVDAVLQLQRAIELGRLVQHPDLDEFLSLLEKLSRN